MSNTKVIPDHSGSDVCSAITQILTPRRTEVDATGVAIVRADGPTHVWSAESTRVDAWPCAGAPRPVELPALGFETRARIDQYVRRVTELTPALGFAAAAAVADAERGLGR